MTAPDAPSRCSFPVEPLAFGACSTTWRGDFGLGDYRKARSCSPPILRILYLAPTAGVAGHFGALQALYFLTGLPTAAEGRLLHLNLWRPNDVRIVAPPYWAECPACGRKPTG